jgi:hypothetical protein
MRSGTPTNGARIRDASWPDLPADSEAFRWEFDFPGASFELTTSTRERRTVNLRDGLSVAQVHGEVMAAMAAVGMPVTISTTPNEIADAIPFPDDHVHATYVDSHPEHQPMVDSDALARFLR